MATRTAAGSLTDLWCEGKARQLTLAATIPRIGPGGAFRPPFCMRFYTVEKRQQTRASIGNLKRERSSILHTLR